MSGIEPANKPAIDPKKIKAIDDFLEDGERDKGYRAFAMMRHIWPQLRELALASSQPDETPYRLPFHDETMAGLASLTIRKEGPK